MITSSEIADLITIRDLINKGEYDNVMVNIYNLVDDIQDRMIQEFENNINLTEQE